MTKVFVIGLTGSTGAGKSEVARIMAERPSWVIIDADVISRRVVEKGQPALNALTEHFSTDILNEDGTLNRKRLAEKAFSSPEETAALNAIVHPAVIREIKRELSAAARYGKAVAVIDAPLLLQAGVDAICNYTVAVVSTPTLRKARIMARDGLTTEEADRRMRAQPSDEYYEERVSSVLYNLGDRESLREAAERLCEKVEGMAV
ncbi:MAG: dephospho-CoA kinase [Clostridia bacterium]|nr:dephospho-CoA kinase [Clostridia bacterium]